MKNTLAARNLCRSTLLRHFSFILLLVEARAREEAAYQASYRKRNRAKLSEYRRGWIRERPDYEAKRKVREVATLSDHYVKSKIAETRSLRFHQIDAGMVAEWRNRIAAHRLSPAGASK